MKAGTNRGIQETPDYKLRYVEAHIHIKKKQIEVLQDEIARLETERDRLKGQIE